jgi:PilZ domain-containing protein
MLHRLLSKLLADSETQLQYRGTFLITLASKHFAVAEKRKNVRLRTLKAGVIAFDKSTISCLVRNVSVSGACLEVASPIGIQDTFTLLMESDHIKRQCHVVWMKDKRIGIHFD